MRLLTLLLVEAVTRSLPCGVLAALGALLRATPILAAVLANSANLSLIALHAYTSNSKISSLRLHGLETVLATAKAALEMVG